MPKRQGFWQFDGSRLATASKPGAAALLTARFSLTALEFGARDTGMFEVRSLSDASPPAVWAAATMRRIDGLTPWSSHLLPARNA